MLNNHSGIVLAAAVILAGFALCSAPAHAQGQSSNTAPPAESTAGVESPKKPDWEVGARVSYWFSTIDGDLRVDGPNGLQGTTVNLKDDLGIDRAYLGAVEAYGRFGRHHVTVGYVETDYSGSTNIPRDILFKGQTYPAGTFVEAELKFKVLNVEYQYDFLRFEDVLSGLSIGGIGKIMYVEGHTTSQAAAIGLSGQGNFYAPIPMIGIGAQLGMLRNLLELRGKFTWSNFSGNTFSEGDGALALRLIPFTELSAGYRIIKYDYEKDALLFNITMSGPYLGLTILY
jgi:hypothetical protein